MYSCESFTNTSVLLFLTSVLLLYFYFQWKSNYWKRKGVNGPKSYPLIGTLWEHVFLANNLLEEKRYQKYGRIYGAMQGWKPILTIGEPELIKQIRITDFRKFINHRPMFPGDLLLSRMVGELNDDEWKRVRSIISPVFSTGKLKAMQPLIEKSINNTLKYFEANEEEDREVDLKKVMLSYTMDTIAGCAFAMETNGYKNPNNEFLKKAADLVTFKIWRLITSLILPANIQNWMNLQLIPQHLINYFVIVLKSVIQERKEKNIRKNDFVNLLIDAELSKEDTNTLSSQNLRQKLTDEEIMAQCFLFFVVGYETTSTLLQFTLYALAMNPKEQRKVFKEINDCYSQNKTFDYDSLMSLPYFDAIVNETLRLYTPVLTFEHICGENYILGDTGITIEKGTVINIPYYAMHHDPQLFSEPYKFIPERFLPKNRDQIHPYSFLPFGTGPRICIGMRFAIFSAKLFLANLINHFEIIITENTVSEPKFDGTFVFLTCKPLMVKFKKRF